MVLVVDPVCVTLNLNFSFAEVEFTPKKYPGIMCLAQPFVNLNPLFWYIPQIHCAIFDNGNVFTMYNLWIQTMVSKLCCGSVVLNLSMYVSTLNSGEILKRTHFSSFSPHRSV